MLSAPKLPIVQNRHPEKVSQRTKFVWEEVLRNHYRGYQKIERRHIYGK